MESTWTTTQFTWPHGKELGLNLINYLQEVHYIIYQQNTLYLTSRTCSYLTPEGVPRVSTLILQIVMPPEDHFRPKVNHPNIRRTKVTSTILLLKYSKWFKLYTEGEALILFLSIVTGKENRWCIDSIVDKLICNRIFALLDEKIPQFINKKKLKAKNFILFLK